MPYSDGAVKGLLLTIRQHVSPGAEIAVFPIQGGPVYYTTWNRRGKEPFSAVSTLVAALHDVLKPVPPNPKIYVLHDPTDMDKGYAKLLNDGRVRNVAAAEVEDDAFGFLSNVTPFSWRLYSDHLDAFTIVGLGVQGPLQQVNMANPLVGRLYMMAVYAKITGTFDLMPIGSAIGAMLVDAHGQILSWAFNTADINNTCHAEVNLIQSYFKENPGRRAHGLPIGATLFTTLKPCSMCAGLILDCAEDRSALRVVYNQHDDTALAGTTSLDNYTTGTGRRIQSLLSATPPGLAHNPIPSRVNWRSAGPRYEAIPIHPPRGVGLPPNPIRDMSRDLENAFASRPPVTKTIQTRHGQVATVTQPPQMTEWLQSIPLRDWARRAANELRSLHLSMGYNDLITDADVRNALALIDRFLRLPRALK